MQENYGRMVNRRIGRLLAGEGENFVGHLGQPARHHRIVRQGRDLGEVPCQGFEFAFEILHHLGPLMTVTDDGVCRACDMVALIWINLPGPAAPLDSLPAAT